MEYIIKNGIIVNNLTSRKGTVVTKENKISEVIYEDEYVSRQKYEESVADTTNERTIVIEADGLHILPGIIDDQVHFREPGLEYKATIESESKAAVLGGVTGFMDMPNNNPPAITIEAVRKKYAIAKAVSYANYAFYLGATNDNIGEIMDANPKEICGVKVFMGSSTGNMLVDNPQTLKKIFSKSPVPVITHCEDEKTIQANLQLYKERYGDNIPFNAHPEIRSRKACIDCSRKAIELAIEHKTDLHILHISTAEEIEMIRSAKKINDKISGEICVHYLWFDSSDYIKYGSKIKCNPAIKEQSDKKALRNAIKNGIIKIVATDHAPHLKEEKERKYLEAPSGLPIIRHSLQMMLELTKQQIFTIEEVVNCMCHAPADRFKIFKRGYILKGNFADITIVDTNKKDSESTLHPPYKCGWTPLEGTAFSNSVIHTFVNGELVVKNGALTGKRCGEAFSFNR